MSTSESQAERLETIAKSVNIVFSLDGNSDVFTRDGWSGSEPLHRWSLGERSVLVLPKIAPSNAFELILECYPLRIGGIIQELIVELNGNFLLRYQPNNGVPFAISVRSELVNNAEENQLVFFNPNALVPRKHDINNRDERVLAFAWRRVTLKPTSASLDVQPGWLPELNIPLDLLDAKDVASEYQSLGENCELGIFQRQCGIEPSGLLRFAAIDADKLIHGLRTRFEGLVAENALSLAASRPGEELVGRHAFYGLAYHTFKTESEVDLLNFKTKELQRLNYLARLFFEQIENNEKIFVRRGGFSAIGEAVALHSILQVIGSEARLLIVQPAPNSSPNWAGRVERLAKNLYRGYLSKFADPDQVQATLMFKDWLRVCATLSLSQLRSYSDNP